MIINGFVVLWFVFCALAGTLVGIWGSKHEWPYWWTATVAFGVLVAAGGILQLVTTP